MMEEDAKVISLSESFLVRHDDDLVLDWFMYLFEREYPNYNIDQRYTEAEKSGTMAFNGKIYYKWEAQTIGTEKSEKLEEVLV